MKAIKITVGGEERHLVFNGAAMFEVEERYENATKLLDEMNRGGRAAFEAICWTVALLAEQGELVRRYLGYDEKPMLVEERIRAVLSPRGVVELKQAIVKAIMLGYGREVEGEGEVDLGLAELNQKKRKR